MDIYNNLLAAKEIANLYSFKDQAWQYEDRLKDGQVAKIQGFFSYYKAAFLHGIGLRTNADVVRGWVKEAVFASEQQRAQFPEDREAYVLRKALENPEELTREELVIVETQRKRLQATLKTASFVLNPSCWPCKREGKFRSFCASLKGLIDQLEQAQMKRYEFSWRRLDRRGLLDLAQEEAVDQGALPSWKAKATAEQLADYQEDMAVLLELQQRVKIWQRELPSCSLSRLPECLINQFTYVLVDLKNFRCLMGYESSREDQDKAAHFKRSCVAELAQALKTFDSAAMEKGVNRSLKEEVKKTVNFEGRTVLQKLAKDIGRNTPEFLVLNRQPIAPEFRNRSLNQEQSLKRVQQVAKAIEDALGEQNQEWNRPLQVFFSQMLHGNLSSSVSEVALMLFTSLDRRDEFQPSDEKQVFLLASKSLTGGDELLVDIKKDEQGKVLSIHITARSEFGFFVKLCEGVLSPLGGTVKPSQSLVLFRTEEGDFQVSDYQAEVSADLSK